MGARYCLRPLDLNSRKEAEAWWNENVSTSPEESPATGGETQAFARVIISR